MSKLRQSGINALGEIPWGSHFCNFYETKQDLLEILVPYFKAGLQNKEFCLWILPGPDLFTKEEAKIALGNAVPDLNEHIAKGDIEIINASEWYLKENEFNLERVINGWDTKLKRALALGYDGMRVSGDTFWLSEGDWKYFYSYERKLNHRIIDIPMIVLCTYPLTSVGAAEIFDVAHNHQFVIARRKGEWEMIETAVQIQAQAEIKRLNKAMRQIKERTPGPHAVMSYGIAVLSVIAAVIVLLWINRNLTDNAPIVSVLLCAVIFSTWFGGTRSGLLAIILATVAFDYYFLLPVYSFVIKITQFPRLFLFMIPALFIVWLSATQRRITESLTHARNVLEETVQKLSQTNAVLHDEITERKKSELLITKEKELSGEIIDSIPGMFMVLDENLRFIRWNKNVELVSGYTPEEILLLHAINDFYDDADERKKVENLMEEAFKKGTIHGEASPRMKDGKKICFYFNGRLINYENKACIISTAIDITERRQAENAVRQSENRTRLIIDTIPIMAWSINPDGALDFVNQRWIDYTGISLEEEMKEPTQIIHPEDLSTVTEKWVADMAAGKPSEIEMRLRRADGEYRWFQVRTEPLYDEQGNVVKWYGISIDITERKLAEETLQQSYEEIRRLTGHLQKAREEERKKIAREIHDELGQQLTAIKMDVAWIDKKTPQETTEIKRKLKNMITLLDGSNQSIRRILSELRPRILDDHGLLEAIEWLGRQFTETMGLPVKFTTTEKDIKISEQIATCIFRVCQEAFTNIIRYSQAKSISNSISIIEENIILIVEDDGIGFDIASVQNKRSFGIMGMRERVLSLGGKFSLVSSPGKGTKITVSLPL